MTAEIVDFGIERLIQIDQRIDANESDALRAGIIRGRALNPNARRYEARTQL